MTVEDFLTVCRLLGWDEAHVHHEGTTLQSYTAITAQRNGITITIEAQDGLTAMLRALNMMIHAMEIEKSL